jgi:hypothetical protein
MRAWAFDGDAAEGNEGLLWAIKTNVGGHEVMIVIILM